MLADVGVGAVLAGVILLAGLMSYAYLGAVRRERLRKRRSEAAIVDYLRAHFDP